MNYSLIIPLYNEDRTLPRLIKKLKNLENENIEVIIIDDGSNDKTKEILFKNNQFIIKRNKVNLGKGASIIKGVSLASNKNIILMDGDLEIDINDVQNLIYEYENSKLDVLTGVRWNEKNDYKKYNVNMLGNYIINIFFNLLFKTKFNDVLCCVKIMSIKVFRSLNIQSQGFSIEVETMGKLVLNRFTIEEMPVRYNRRTTQEGKKLKFSDGWHILGTMLKMRFTKK